MLIDSNEIRENQVFRAKAVVIGAGPAGLSLALKFKRFGIETLIIDKGSTSVKPSENGAVCPAPDAYSYDLNASRGEGFGGSSGLWNFPPGWRARALDEEDFEDKEWMSDCGWPVTRESLEPYYAEAHRLFGLGLQGYEVKDWYDERQCSTFNRFCNGNNKDITVSIIKHARLDTFTRLFKQLRDDKTIKLIFDSCLINIQVDETGTAVRRFRCKTQGGTQFFVESEYYVLACGGVGNAQLMACSGLESRFPALGKYFMEHIHATVGTIECNDPIPEEVASMVATNPPSSIEDSHSDNLCNIATILRVSRTGGKGAGVGSCIFFLHPESRLHTCPGYRSLMDLKRMQKLGIAAPGNVNRLHWVNVIRSMPDMLWFKCSSKLHPTNEKRHFRVTMESEQAPTVNSKVLFVGPQDEYGLPGPRLDWQFCDQDYYTIQKSLDLLDRFLLDNGIGKLVERFPAILPTPQLGGGSHHMGTTRMGQNSDSSVVDGDCKVHGIDNLYVAGSSVFPSGGSSNPTLTVLALALKLGDFIVQSDTRAMNSTLEIA